VKRWQKPWWTTHPSSPFAGWIDKKNLPIIINHPPLSQVEPKCLSKCLLLGPCLSSCPAKLREAIPCHSANVKAINTENQMINPVFGRCALYQRYKPLCVFVCACLCTYPSGNHLKNHGNHGNGKIPIGSFKNRSNLDVSSGSNSFTKDSSMGGW
jgi:hypothetical protein